MLGIQHELGCSTLTLVHVLSLAKFAQPVVPLGLEHVGDQAVVGMHSSEAPRRFTSNMRQYSSGQFHRRGRAS